jgi:hypothetical protein
VSSYCAGCAASSAAPVDLICYPENDPDLLAFGLLMIGWMAAVCHADLPRCALHRRPRRLRFKGSDAT